MGKIEEKAHKAIIEGAGGRVPSQGLFESDKHHRNQIKEKAYEAIIEGGGGRVPSQGLFESNKHHRDQLEERAHKATIEAHKNHGGGGGGGGGFEFLGEVFGSIWWVLLVPAAVVGILLLAIFPPLWLVWRLFRKKNAQSSQDFVGTGWTVLGTVLAWIGTTALGLWLVLSSITLGRHLHELRQSFAELPHVGLGVGALLVLHFLVSFSWPLSALIGGIDLLRKNSAYIAPGATVVVSIVSCAVFAGIFETANSTAVGGVDEAHQQIAGLLNSYADAVRARDANRIAEYYAPTVSWYFLRPNTAREEVRTDFYRKFEKYSEAREFTITDVKIIHINQQSATARFDRRWDFVGQRPYSGDETEQMVLEKTTNGWEIIADCDVELHWTTPQARLRDEVNCLAVGSASAS